MRRSGLGDYSGDVTGALRRDASNGNGAGAGLGTLLQEETSGRRGSQQSHRSTASRVSYGEEEDSWSEGEEGEGEYDDQEEEDEEGQAQGCHDEAGCGADNNAEAV